MFDVVGAAPSQHIQSLLPFRDYPRSLQSNARGYSGIIQWDEKPCHNCALAMHERRGSGARGAWVMLRRTVFNGRMIEVDQSKGVD